MDKNLRKVVKFILISILIFSIVIYSYLIFQSGYSIFSVLKNLKTEIHSFQDGINISFSTKNEGNSQVDLNFTFQLYSNSNLIFSKSFSEKISANKEFSNHFLINFTEIFLEFIKLNESFELNNLSYKINGFLKSEYLSIKLHLT